MFYFQQNIFLLFSLNYIPIAVTLKQGPDR